MEQFKDILKGDFSKKTLTHYYIPIMVGSILLGLLLAYLFYPYNPSYPYNWTTSMISRLGWPLENPIGFIFFSIGFCIFGLLLIPFSLYSYKIFSQMNEKKSKMIVILGISIGIATFLIGAIPNYEDPIIFAAIHGINALIIFVGSYIMFAIINILLINEHKIKKSDGVINQNLRILYLMLYLFSLVSFILSGLFLPFDNEGHYIHSSGAPAYASPTTYEWFALMSIIGIYIVQAFMLPDEL